MKVTAKKRSSYSIFATKYNEIIYIYIYMCVCVCVRKGCISEICVLTKGFVFSLMKLGDSFLMCSLMICHCFVCTHSADQLCYQHLWQPGVSARSHSGWHTLVQQTALFPSSMECIHIRYNAQTLVLHLHDF